MENFAKADFKLASDSCRERLGFWGILHFRFSVVCGRRLANPVQASWLSCSCGAFIRLLAPSVAKSEAHF
jgi:hypothetical protein